MGTFLSDLGVAQTAVNSSNISNRWTITLYNQWTAFFTNLHIYHLLEDPNLPSSKILQVYIQQVHHSYDPT